MGQVIWFVMLGTCVWVYFDARELGVRKGGLGGGGLDMSPRSWVICCAFIWLIAFPAYLIARSRYRDRGPVQTGWPIETWPATAPLVPIQHVPTQQVAPPQLSADGHWWWNGTQWVPAAGAARATG